MPTFSRLFPWLRKWLLWAVVGGALRLLLIWFPRAINDGTIDYLRLGRNLFRLPVPAPVPFRRRLWVSFRRPHPGPVS
jgi:hypothetical protein